MTRGQSMLLKETCYAFFILFLKVKVHQQTLLSLKENTAPEMPPQLLPPLYL